MSKDIKEIISTRLNEIIEQFHAVMDSDASTEFREWEYHTDKARLLELATLVANCADNEKDGDTYKKLYDRAIEYIAQIEKVKI